VRWLLILITLAACGDDAARVRDADAGQDAGDPGRDAAPDAASDAGCPADMVDNGGSCMDRYEAPNRAGALPLVMYSYLEAQKWCQAREKRLCYDDEWTRACAGPANLAYPYGATHVPSACNDSKTWIAYNQTELNFWPSGAASPTIASLDELYAAANTGSGARAVTEVRRLYQGEGAGSFPRCVGPAGAYDLVGSAEEWTTRRDGGMTLFHGNLKGRYWAESRTCQGNVTTHGDAFRFYEIGFRCCR
jgi:formylglycine-generating enzyme required for sulfatase activity